MATGDNTSISLADSLDDMAAAGRIRREFVGVIPQLVENRTLDANTGSSWSELLYEQTTAHAVDETTMNENFQRFDDSANALITSNVTESGGVTGISGVFHGFVIKDFFDELTAGIGTYPVPAGVTADVFQNGWSLPIDGTAIFKNGNIPIVGTDAKGYVFAREAWILVSGMSIKTERERMPRRGGGGDAVTMTDEFAYGQRSPGNWSVEIASDATAPA